MNSTVFFDTVFDDSGSTLAEPPEANPANVTDCRPYTYWTPPALPATLTSNSASTRAADYALILYHNLFSCGCTVEVWGSDDAFATAGTLLGSNTPTNDRDAALILFTSASYKSWRLNITGTATPTIAIAMIGARLELPRNVQEGFDPIGRAAMGPDADKEGTPVGRLTLYEKWEESVTLSLISPTWIRESFVPAWDLHLQHTPFAFAWNPEDYPEETLLVSSSDGQFAAPHSGLWSNLTFKITGVIQ